MHSLRPGRGGDGDRSMVVFGQHHWTLPRSRGFPEAEPKNWDGLLGLQTRINYIVFIYIRTVRTTDFLSKKVASGFFVIRAACCPGSGDRMEAEALSGLQYSYLFMM